MNAPLRVTGLGFRLNKFCNGRTKVFLNRDAIDGGGCICKGVLGRALV
jgi:hypothetical protein